MNRNYILPLLYLFLVTGMTLVSCSTKSPGEKSGRIKVVATTGMIGDAVLQIADGRVDLVTLMGPGVDPHLYKATHGDLEHLTNADLILYNGLHLEGKMGEVFEKLGRVKPVIAVAKSIPVSNLRRIEGTDSIYDPHIWFDVSLWKQAVVEVGRALQQADPANKDFYEAKLTAYLNELHELHQAVKDSLATLPANKRVLITAHDAFGYFGDAYGVEVHGLQGISTQSEFGLNDVSRLTELIVGRQVKAIFVESSVSPKSIEAVVQGCRQKGWNVAIGGSLYSDALGDSTTAAGTYAGMVRANVATLLNALR